MKLLIVLLLVIAFAGAVISEDITDEVFEEEQYDEEEFDDEEFDDRETRSDSGRAKFKLCSKLRHLQYGQVKLTGRKPGKKAIYSCKSGFTLFGSSKRRCLSNGRWSGRAPTCKRRTVLCPKLRDPNNGDVKLTGLRPGKTARYSCNNGFILVGSTIRKCLSNGKWSGRAPFCKVKQVLCPDLDDPQNGDVNVNGPQRPGQIARYSCDGGFTLVGSKTRRCLSNGVWSGRAPFCKIKQIFCPDLDDPQNGDVDVDGPQRPGQIARYSCDGGFTLVGSKTRRCSSNGVWSGRAPFCREIIIIRKCPKLKGLIYGNIYASGYHPGDYAVFQCNYGYTLIGQPHIVCLDNGYWSGNVPACVRGHKY